MDSWSLGSTDHLSDHRAVVISTRRCKACGVDMSLDMLTSGSIAFDRDYCSSCEATRGITVDLQDTAIAFTLRRCKTCGVHMGIGDSIERYSHFHQ